MADISPEMRRELLLKAPSFQGGHSIEGYKIAEQLGISFPLRMPSLEAYAISHGLEPFTLWPWLASLRESTCKDTSND